MHGRPPYLALPNSSCPMSGLGICPHSAGLPPRHSSMGSTRRSIAVRCRGWQQETRHPLAGRHCAGQGRLGGRTLSCPGSEGPNLPPTSKQCGETLTRTVRRAAGCRFDSRASVAPRLRAGGRAEGGGLAPDSTPAQGRHRAHRSQQRPPPGKSAASCWTGRSAVVGDDAAHFTLL